MNAVITIATIWMVVATVGWFWCWANWARADHINDFLQRDNDKLAIQNANLHQLHFNIVMAQTPPYDAGLLGDGGGGDVDWWHDYIRVELARADEYYRGGTFEQPTDS